MFDNGRHGAARGFSTIELVVVVGIITILTAITVFSLTSGKRNYSTDDEAAKVVSLLREAYQRALAQRQTFKVEINLTRMEIRLTDEGRLPGGDEVELTRAVLNEQVSLNRPAVGGTPVPLPPAPYSYNPAAFATDTDGDLVWSARFRSDGSVMDAAGNPLSATIFFAPANFTERDANLVRAVTIFSGSGSIRAWKYDGTTFSAETRR